MSRTASSARQALLDAATSLLAHNPGASFIEIAQAAGVGRASLYRHFPTRKDLIHELGMEAIRQTDQASSHVMADASSATHALRLIIEALIPLGDRFYFLLRLPLIDDEEITRHLKRQNAQLKTLILAAQQEGGINNALPVAWVLAVFNNLIYTGWQIVEEEKYSCEQATDLVFATFCDGMASHGAPDPDGTNI